MAVGTAQRLIVDRHYFARAADDAKVAGVVTNTGDGAVDEVTLTAKLYREGESFVSNRLDPEDGLDPDRSKRFGILLADVEDRTVERYTVGTSPG